MTTAPLPEIVPVSRDSVAEIARRAERAHADHRIGVFERMRGPSRSSAARRDAHVADLQMVTGHTWADIMDHLRGGDLIEFIGGSYSRAPATCSICGRPGEVIVAKRAPSDAEVYVVCRNERNCIKLSAV